MTAREAYEIWYEDMRDLRRASSMQTYACHWSRFEPYVGATDVGMIGQPEVRGLVRVMEEQDLSAATMEARVRVLKQVIKFAALCGEQVKPTEWKIRYPRQEKQKALAYQPDEVRTILERISCDMAEDRNVNIGALISLFTGMRIGEVCGLKWKDIKFGGQFPVVNVCRQAHTLYFGNRPRLIIEDIKTEAGYRTIPLLPQLSDALKSYRGKSSNPDNYVVGDSPIPFTERGVRENYRKLIYSMPVRKLKFHSLRHTFATMYMATDSEVTALSKIMGHSSVTITMDLYVHPSEQYKRDALMKAFGKTRLISFKKKES